MPPRSKTEPPRSFELPIEPDPIVDDISKYVMVIYGEEKIGKTVFLASFPEALFLCTEPGTKGLQVFSFNGIEGVTSWEMFLTAVGLLEADPDKFKFVVIDTVDRLYEQCMTYVCDSKEIPYPGENRDGSNDFGKSWNAVRTEFQKALDRIVRTGRGLAMTSHVKEIDIKPKSGGPGYTKIQPSMGSQARNVCIALADMTLYLTYMADPGSGRSQRVIITQGDEVVRGGSRVELPPILPLTRTGGFEILQAAFKGEYVGLDPETLMASKTASKELRRHLVNIQTDSEPKVTKKKLSKKKGK